MTVIEFGKRDLKINSYIAILTVILVISAVAGIILYNSLINLRHDVSNNEDSLAKLQVQVAELGNNLDKMTNGAYDANFIQTTGLVIDKNPSYVAPLNVVSQATR